MALLLDAGRQFDAGMSFKPLTGQQQCTCLATKVCVPHTLDSSSYFQPLTFQCMKPLYLYFIVVSMWCVLLPPRIEKCTKTEDKKRPEKKTAFMKIAG